MALQKNRSLVRAEHVVNLILSCDEGRDIDGYVDAYQNCREQGYQIWGFEDAVGCGRSFFIAEHRNIDNVVVYFGEYSSHSLSDDAYAHPNFFKTEEEAAKFIIDTARPLVKIKREKYAEWLKEYEAEQKAGKKEKPVKLPKPGKAKRTSGKDSGPVPVKAGGYFE